MFMQDGAPRGGIICPGDAEEPRLVYDSHNNVGTLTDKVVYVDRSGTREVRVPDLIKDYAGFIVNIKVGPGGGVEIDRGATWPRQREHRQFVQLVSLRKLVQVHITSCMAKFTAMTGAVLMALSKPVMQYSTVQHGTVLLYYLSVISPISNVCTAGPMTPRSANQIRNQAIQHLCLSVCHSASIRGRTRQCFALCHYCATG